MGGMGVSVVVWMWNSGRRSGQGVGGFGIPASSPGNEGGPDRARSGMPGTVGQVIGDSGIVGGTWCSGRVVSNQTLTAKDQAAKHTVDNVIVKY